MYIPPPLRGCCGQREDHDKLFPWRASGRSVRFPVLQNQEPFLSAFPSTLRANIQRCYQKKFSSNPSFTVFQTDRAIVLIHGSVSQAPPWDRLYLSIYILDSCQSPSQLSLIWCQRPGIQHPPRRHSLKSSTTKDELGRSWKIFYKPTLYRIAPQRMTLCRLPEPVQTP